MPYKAFISYSHTADGDFADALHDAMEKLAKPWNKRRARRVVLDKTAMAAGSSLGETINEKLAESEWLVLLVNPDAADSKWCEDEIDYWAEHKSMDNVVVALTGGEIEVDPHAQHINWEKSTALSPSFRAAVGEDAVPLYEDLRPFKRDVDHATLRNAHFRDEVAKIVGRIEGEDPGELASEEKRQFSRTVRLRRAAEIGLILLTVAAVVFGIQAINSASRAAENERQAIAEAERADENAETAEANADEAQANAVEAQQNADEALANAEQARREADRARSSALASQAIAASSEIPDLAALMALESVRIAPTVDAFISVVDSVVNATNFVWRTTVQDEPIIGAATWSSDGDVAVLGTEFGDLLFVSPDDPTIEGFSIGDQYVLDVAVVAGTSLARTLGLIEFDDGTVDGILTTVDLDSGAITEDALGTILGGAISRDASTIAVIADVGNDEYELVVYNEQGEEIVFAEGLDAPGGDCGPCVAISDDGSQVAWVETDPVFFDDVVWTWDLNDRFADVFATEGLVVSLTYTPGGGHLIVGDDEGSGYFLPASGTFAEDLEPLLVSDSEILTYSFAESDGASPTVLATGHLNGSVRIWQFDESAATADLAADLTRHNDEVRSVVVSADGSEILSGGWDGDIMSWRTTPTANHGVITPGAHDDNVADVTFVGDQTTLASVGYDGFVRFWDGSSRGLLSETSAQDRNGQDRVVLFSIAAHPDGNVLAVGGTLFPLDDEGLLADDRDIEDFVEIVDAVSGEVLTTLGGLPEESASLAFSPDGQYLAVGIASGPVLVWRTDGLDGAPLWELDAYAFTTGGVAFSGDSRLLAAGTVESGGDDVGIWDVASGDLLLTVPGNFAATATAVALNLDGTILAWGDDTRLISLWHIPTNQQIGENLTGHREPISDLEFTDVDGDGIDGLLTSTSDDATTRVWEIQARRLVARIEAHSKDVTAVTISPGANLIVTSSADDSLWVGDLNPETWVSAACVLAGRNMNQEEWDALELDGDYVRHCAEYESGNGAPPDAEIWSFMFTGVDTGEE